MDAILFSAKPNLVVVDDAIRHLADHDQLYWEVGWRISPIHFTFPILGFIHISGGQVEYRVTIPGILPFSPEHYENETLAAQVKPEVWIQEWKENLKKVRSLPWRTALVMDRIEPFSYDTYAFRKWKDGMNVTKAPQNYSRVIPPDGASPTSVHVSVPVRTEMRTYVGTKPQRQSNLAERNLEDFVMQELEALEPGLRLVERQLSTPAGRLDLLCKDSEGNFVVVELKRGQGTDQVVGQVLRYMGWAQQNYKTDSVRGIIVVGKKDQALSFAVLAAPKIQVKVFRLSIE
jgi:hypothetical protein